MRHIIAMQTTGFTSTYVLSMSILGLHVAVGTRVMQCVSSLLLRTRSLDIKPFAYILPQCNNIHISIDILITQTSESSVYW